MKILSLFIYVLVRLYGCTAVWHRSVYILWFVCCVRAGDRLSMVAARQILQPPYNAVPPPLRQSHSDPSHQVHSIRSLRASPAKITASCSAVRLFGWMNGRWCRIAWETILGAPLPLRLVRPTFGIGRHNVIYDPPLILFDHNGSDLSCSFCRSYAAQNHP